ncbi:MAG: hypothetical protein CMJ53_06055 [Planctomycetaceae bacterium]|nr:hypothetical protein [Planctomycetaceae bacterium]|tara:strand:+ start:1552 stop:2076 length:525 start_codon:yes stop_codon:yes gene_type:complete
MTRLPFILLALCLLCPGVHADTGLLREVVRTDEAHVLIFTAPAALRAGTSEVVVVVNDPESGAPIEGVDMLVEARMSHWSPQRPSMVFGAIEDDTLRLGLKSLVDLQSEGDWLLQVRVSMPGESPMIVPLEVSVAAALAGWLAYGPVLLFWLPCMFVVLLRDRILLARHALRAA